MYNTLGPGILESAYEVSLAYELVKAGRTVKTQVAIPLIYEEVKFDAGFRIDLVVEDTVLICRLHHR